VQLTRASDYAVRVIIHLATLPPGSKMQQAELSRATDVSGHFLSKVLQQLVRCQFIRSQRGSGGGFALAIPASSVSLLDVVEAIEGPLRLNLCIKDGPSCDRKANCPAHEVWADAQAALVKVLGTASIASLAVKANSMKGAHYLRHEEPVWISGVPRASRTRSQARDGR